MGSWGMAPWENDDYADLWGEVRACARSGKGGPLFTLVYNRISERPNDGTELWARVGVALMFLNTGMLSPDDSWEVAHEARNVLTVLSKDGDFLQSWRNPAAFRKMFQGIAEEIDDEIAGYPHMQKPLIQAAFEHLEKDGHKGELPAGRRRKRR